MPPIAFEDFLKVDIRAGTVLSCKPLAGAKKPAYLLTISLGETLGTKQSTAQLTALYAAEELVGRQVLCVVNFPKKRVAGVDSEVLVLGLYAQDGVVLIAPERRVQDGDRLG